MHLQIANELKNATQTGGDASSTTAESVKNSLTGASTSPLCGVELHLAKAFALPRPEKPQTDASFLPTSSSFLTASTGLSQQETTATLLKGFPVVVLYTNDRVIKSGISQQIFLSNFPNGTQVEVKLLAAFDRKNLFAPAVRDGWPVTMVPSFDGSAEHMVVSWDVDPEQPRGKYFLSAYQSENPAWFSFSQPFDVDGPTDGLENQPSQPPGVTSLSATEILEKVWRQPVSRRRKRRASRRNLGQTEVVNIFSASGTDAALTKALQKALTAPEELWLSSLDMPYTQVAMGNLTLVREIVRRVPMLKDYPAVAQLDLDNRDDQSPLEVRQTEGCFYYHHAA